MTPVEGDIAVVAPKVKAVRCDGAALRLDTGWRVACCVGQVARPHIARLELQSVREALGRGDTHAAVVALCPVDDALDVPPALIGRIERESCIPADRIGGNLIDIDKRLELRP